MTLALGLLSSCLVDENNQPVEDFEVKVSAIVTGDKDERRLVPDVKYVDKSTVAFVNASNSAICTGTTVGVSFILTAAHCVFDVQTKELKKGITVIPALHQSHNHKPYSRFHIKRAFLLEHFVKDVGFNGYTPFAAARDLAIVQLREWNESTTYLSDVSSPVEIAYSNSVNPNDEKFEVISYTAESGLKKNSQYYQHGGCSAKGRRGAYPAFYHDCDTGPGSSGMALVKTNGGKFQIAGIHTGGAADENSAAMLTPELKSDVEKILSYQFDNLQHFEAHDLRAAPFFGFDLKNNCSSAMEIAVYYNDIDGKSRIHGPLTIESGELYMARLAAANSQVKVYGKTKDGRYSFTGNETIYYGSNSSLNFFNYEIEGMYQDGLVKFNCK